MKRNFFVITLLVISLPAAADRIKVAVVPGVAVNLDSARVDALAQDLADALASELDIDAIGGLAVRRMLPADGVPADCHTVPACVADVGKRLGASQLLFVGMVDAAGSGAVQVDSIWIDLATGRSGSRPAIDVPSVTDAKSRFAAAAKALLPDAPIKRRPAHDVGPGVGAMSPEVPRHFTTTTYALAGAAVVGLGVGVGFGLAARAKFNACETVACSQPEKDGIRTRTIIADSGFAIALGGAVAASIVYATSGKESHLVVSPSPAGVALAAVGRF